MALSIRNPKDLAAGLAYCAFGMAGTILARHYELGEAGQMGPGYFPTAIAGCLTLLGLVSILRSVVASGERIARISWRPLVLVTLSVALFAFLLPRLGIVASLAALLALAIFASRGARLTSVGMAAAACLIAFCVAVFVKGLGVPLPLVGSWVGG